MGTDQYLYSVKHIKHSVNTVWGDIVTWLNQSAASTLSAFDMHDSEHA